MKRILLLFAPLLFPLSISAQVSTGIVTGRVADATGSPIPGAHVLIESARTGTATDAAGGFRLEAVPTGEHVLRVSALGYHAVEVSVQVTAGEDVRIDVALQERTLESVEVVVTASRRTQETALVPVSVSLVTRDQLLERNIRSLDQALQNVPGVQMAENQVNVRGSSGFSYNVGSRVLLLIDGVPMLGPETGGIPFDAIPMPQVARIEVIKGPGSALYGSGALGGIINVITRGFPEQPETSVSVFGGAHDPVRHGEWRSQWEGGERYRTLGGASLTHARRIGGRAGGWLHASYRRDQGYLRLGADEVMQAYLKLGWDPSSSLALRLFGGITGRERDSFLYWAGLDNPLNPGSLDLLAPGGNDVTGSNDNRSIQLSILPTARHVLGPTLLHHLRLRYFLIQIRPIDEFGNTRPLEAGTTGFRLGGEWQLDWQPRSGQFLTGGLSIDANAARSDFFRASGGQLVFAQPEYAAFAQYEHRLTQGLNVLVGMRFDAYQIDTSATASRLSPMASISFEATPYWTLRASFGRGFRVPGIAERYMDNQDFFPFYPNYGLKPELSTGYEAGMRVEQVVGAGWRVDVDAALFWNEYQRLVEPLFVTDPEGAGVLRPGFQFVNLTSARIAGGEVSVALAAGRTVAASAGYTYLYARDLEADVALPFRSPHLLKLTADFSVGRGFGIGLDYRGASRPKRIDSDFARFVPDAEVMVDMHVVDVRVRYQIGGLTIAPMILNALDHYYVERPAYLAPPRQFMMQIRYDF